MTTELRAATRGSTSAMFRPPAASLSFMVRDPAQLDAAVERMRDADQAGRGLTGTRDWDVQVVDSTRIVLTPTEAASAKALKDAMTVARDVVRRRIDPQGTKEITVITRARRCWSRCRASRIPKR